MMSEAVAGRAIVSGALGFESLALYYDTEEAKEGTRAFLERRPPDFRGKRGG